MSFNLRFAFGIALAVFTFVIVNIMLFGLGVSDGISSPIVNNAIFPLLYFIFTLMYSLVILFFLRSKLSSRSSLLIMLILIALLSVSAAYSTTSFKSYLTINQKIDSQKEQMTSELSAIEAQISAYKEYSDAIINLTNQYTTNNANLKLKLTELKKKKADADAELQARQQAIEDQRKKLEQEMLAESDTTLSSSYNSEQYFEDD